MRDILVTLAMPPTGLVLLILAGLIISFRWLGAGRGVAAAGAVALLLLGMPAVSTTMLRALETDLPVTPPPGHPPKAIIILGGDTIRAADEPLKARPGLLTLDRLRTGVELQHRTGLPILVTGGSTQEHTVPVALVMQRSLTDDFGATVRWVEPKSRDTWENARFSEAILREAGIDSVYVVTHAWHMRRALLAFSGTGLTVTAAPVPPDNPLGPEAGDFLPRPSAWQTGYYALHEFIGYAFYRWFR